MNLKVYIKSLIGAMAIITMFGFGVILFINSGDNLFYKIAGWFNYCISALVIWFLSYSQLNTKEIKNGKSTRN